VAASNRPHAKLAIIIVRFKLAALVSSQYHQAQLLQAHGVPRIKFKTITDQGYFAKLPGTGP
jgi:hypothetical protein